MSGAPGLDFETWERRSVIRARFSTLSFDQQNCFGSRAVGPFGGDLLKDWKGGFCSGSDLSERDHRGPEHEPSLVLVGKDGGEGRHGRPGLGPDGAKSLCGR